MLAFLITTSSSLVFYVGLLVALHHDGRKRRVGTGPVRKISLGKLSTAAAISTAAIAARRRNPTPVLVRFGETTGHEKARSQVAVSEPAEVIYPSKARPRQGRPAMRLVPPRKESVCSTSC